MPPTKLFLILSFLAMTFFMSSFISFTSNPNSSPFNASLYASADLTRDFVGIHPTLRQVPPKLSFSTIIVSKPFLAPYIAETYPPGPAPITKRSIFKFSFLPFIKLPK